MNINALRNRIEKAEERSPHPPHTREQLEDKVISLGFEINSTWAFAATNPNRLQICEYTSELSGVPVITILEAK